MLVRESSTSSWELPSCECDYYYSVGPTFLFFFKIVASVISILLNSLVVAIIICYRELNCKARDIFLLFIIWSDLLAFIPPLLEIAYLFYPLG